MSFGYKPMIHYKLRNCLDHETLEIEKREISCADLKEKIHVAMGISKERFSLNLLENHSKRVYPNDKMIPHCTMVLVQRVPTAGVKTKISLREQFVVAKKPVEETNHVEPEKWNAMSEEDRIAHMTKTSSEKYHEKNWVHDKKKGFKAETGAPPVGYVCKKCHQQGHWIQACPLKKYKTANGILASELMPCDKEDPLAMVTSDGRFVKRILEHKLHEELKRKRAARDEERSCKRKRLC
ncbi:hypothetical protein L596_009063 [Steinernema carpocapsae]|uniref:DWNN domain-containing protein n=1 Tax=Steinernema carpocapsae TaxID=34508 RepID=A0A4U5PEG7_STECR|nr:hypothetical protein L596_009063 [Steinernema carpocapsae]